jgi:hypothetical protein
MRRRRRRRKTATWHLASYLAPGHAPLDDWESISYSWLIVNTGRRKLQ